MADVLLPEIENRWSPRSFSSQLVEPQKIISLFRAAGMAPSAFNDQPWSYFIGYKEDITWKVIFETLAEGNKAWAKAAPVLVIAAGRTSWSRDESSPNPTWMYDLGQSVAFLTLQAQHLGIWVHQMGGFDAQAAAVAFHLPETWKAVTAIALGYRGDPSSLPADLAAIEKGPKKRKEFATFVFSEKFGQPNERFKE